MIHWTQLMQMPLKKVRMAKQRKTLMVGLLPMIPKPTG
jgi:hypothetical protein